jgi:hypothetical protein
MNLLKSVSIIFLSLGAFSCVKDKPQIVSNPEIHLSDYKKVYVVCEGNFMVANSAISLYDPGTGEVIENLFQSKNQTALGDVAQSICQINSSFYIVVNNSGKVVVCDKNMKQTGLINGLTSPRYIAQASNSKAYISDLYANHIKIVDLNTNSTTGTIPCAGWTEKMLLFYGKMFVTNLKKEYVYVIDVTSDQIKDSIHVGPNAASIVADRYDKLWVLSGGDQNGGIPSSLKQIDPLTLAVTKNFTFPAHSAGQLHLNATKDTLYYIFSDVFRLPVNASSLPSQAFIQKNNRTFYGLGCNPNDHRIYVSDALDYIQRSNVYVYDTKGDQKTMFKTGINASSFYFE